METIVPYSVSTFLVIHKTRQTSSFLCEDSGGEAAAELGAEGPALKGAGSRSLPGGARPELLPQ